MYEFFRQLFKDPKAIFIQGIVAKWYMLVMIPAIALVYKIFVFLHERGIFAKLENFITHQLDSISTMVDRCLSATADFSSLPSLLHCIY